MANENQNNQQQQLPEGSFVIPREYLIEGMKMSIRDVYRMEQEARKKYGNRYNEKNSFEECERRFGFSDPEKMLQEYELIFQKKSNQPAVIRNVLKQMGDNARQFAIRKYVLEQKAKEENQKKD